MYNRHALQQIAYTFRLYILAWKVSQSNKLIKYTKFFEFSEPAKVTSIFHKIERRRYVAREAFSFISTKTMMLEWCSTDPKTCVDSFNNAELMFLWISGRTRGEVSSSCSSWQEVLSVRPEYFLHVPLHRQPLWDLLLPCLYSLQSAGTSVVIFSA